MRLSKISLINSILIALFLLAVLATNVSAETTFYDNPDDALIFAPVSAPASVQQTGGHGSRTANITAPAATNCTQNWICGDWSSCASGFQTRACADSNDCDNRHNKGNVSKVIATQKPAGSRDCKETALPKVETPVKLAEAPTPKKQTAPPICGDAPVKLAISPIVSAIALLVIATILIKSSLRKKGDYVIVYLHRDKQQNNKFYIKKGDGNNFQNDKRQRRNNSLK